MTQIIRDPLVADNIHEVDLAEPGGADLARTLYEEGGLVLLRGCRLVLDYPFLNSLDFDFDAPEAIRRKVKKYADKKIIALSPESTDPMDSLVFANVFAGDAGRLAYFQDQVASGNRQVEAIYRRVFPRYTDFRQVLTWRFTDTNFENLHWDNFHIDQEFHQVRVFANIDRTKRIWRTSHRLDVYADQIYDTARLASLADKAGDDLVIHINKNVLGGMTSPCMDRLPKHHIAFEQGDIWLAETRLVSHQIYHGRKAVAAMFFVDPTTMDRPELVFDERIRRLHQSHAVASATSSRAA